MRHIVFMGARRYTFMKRSDLRADETPMAFTQAQARQIIDPMLRNISANRTLRTLLKEASAFAILAKLGDREVSAQLAKRLASGEIKVIAADPSQAMAGLKKVEKAPEEKPAPKVLAATDKDTVHWIKFKVVDDKDQPIKGIKLNLAISGKAPESHGVKGAFLHLKDLAPGTCDVKAVESGDVYEVVEFKG